MVEKKGEGQVIEREIKRSREDLHGPPTPARLHLGNQLVGKLTARLDA